MGDVIDAHMLSLDEVAPVANHGAPPPAGDPAGEASLKEYFRRFVLEHPSTLGETESARRLGISRKTLWERRQRLNLPRPK